MSLFSIPDPGPILILIALLLFVLAVATFAGWPRVSLVQKHSEDTEQNSLGRKNGD